MTNSIVTLTDSYKLGQYSQYPDNMVSMYSYLESRGGQYPATVFVGLQYYIKKYLLKVPTKTDVIMAAKLAAEHGEPFNKAGWDYIVELGYLPVSIKAVPEGSLIPTGLPLLVIESTDPEVPWLPGYLETLLLKLWYPITIATKSYYIKQTLLNYGPPDWANFALHNFSDRGCTSVESASLAGFAHSTQFMGTDNFNSLLLPALYYNSTSADSFSVWASEHSTTTSYGRDGEEQFVWDQLQKNPDAPIMSFVADSYDVYAFTDMVTNPSGRIRQLLDSRPHQKLVIRPDSGDPIEVLERILEIMYANCETDRDTRPITFKQYGLLWGDGITPEQIEAILEHVTALGYAAENFIFGSGGDLAQNITRDTNKFAIKCSQITVQSDIDCTPEELHTMNIDIFKDPITDPGKKSKRGRVTTIVKDGKYELYTQQYNELPEGYEEALKPVFHNGKLLIETNLTEIRNKGN